MYYQLAILHPLSFDIHLSRLSFDVLNKQGSKPTSATLWLVLFPGWSGGGGWGGVFGLVEMEGEGDTLTLIL